MASKLTLRFMAPGVIGETISINTDSTYTFKNSRLGYGQVSIIDNLTSEPTIRGVAQNFKEAFNADNNFLGQMTVTVSATNTAKDGTPLMEGVTHYLVEIVPKFDNFFDGFLNNASFIDETFGDIDVVTPATIDAEVSQATNNPCGNYKVVITTNQTEGRIEVVQPIGRATDHVITLDGSLSYEVEMNRPSISGSGAVLLYATDTSKRNIGEVRFTAPPVLSIQNISLDGSPFGAVATIETNSGISRTYSLDNTEYQGSKVFAGLLAGSYTAYVKDDLGCTKSKTFTVTEDLVQGLTAPPFIRVPIHNSIRFAQRTGNNFLNYLSTENPGYVNINQYYQEYLVGDPIRTQFKSSYSDNKVFLIDEQGEETEISIIKKSDNINRVNIYEGNYTEKEGRLAVYFTSGDIYNPDGTTKENGHILNGTLPIWYEEGMYLNIEGIGVTQIDRLSLDEDGNRYAITQTDAAGTVLSKKITSIHTAHPYEVYEFEVTFPNKGLYQLRLEYGSEFYLSEVIRINEELPENFLEVQWWNENNNDILYNTGIRHFRRLGWEQYFNLIPKTEKETYDTDTSVELVNSKSFAVYSLSFESMPMELARGLQVAFDNSSTIVINGAVFVAENPVTIEQQGQWCDFEAELTLTDQTMDGQQEIVDVINAEFLNVGTDNNVSFLRL